VDNAIVAPKMGITMFQPSRPYVPYVRTHNLLAYGPKGLMLLGVMALLTQMILGEPVRVSTLALVTGAYVAQFLCMDGIGPFFPTVWWPWGLGTGLTCVLSFFILRRHAMLPRILLQLLVLVFSAYPLAGLLFLAEQRIRVDTAVQIGLIIYVFGLILYSRIRARRARPG
jgi:hypothetical protein